MKQTTNIRKAVCAMANELKKVGYFFQESVEEGKADNDD